MLKHYYPPVKLVGNIILLSVRSTARRPSFKGTEGTSWGDVSKSMSAFISGYYKYSGVNRPSSVPSSLGDMPGPMKTWVSSKTLLGSAAAATLRDLIFFPVVNPGTNKLNLGALRAVLGGRGAAADISPGALNSARSMARGLLDSQFAERIKVKSMKAGARLGSYLRRIRKTTGKTLSDIAMRTKYPVIDEEILGMIEDGHIVRPPNDVLIELARVFNDLEAVDINLDLLVDLADRDLELPIV